MARSPVRSWVPVLLVATGTVAVVAASFVVAKLSDVSVTALVRDANSTSGVAWHVGSLSLVGVLVWASASAVAVFASTRAHPPDRAFLRPFGILGLVLALDDALLLHEEVVPAILGSDLAEYALYAVYALVAVAIGWRSWRVLTPVARAFGLAMGAMFACSALIDVLDLPQLYIEDTFKLVGIAFWAGLAVVQSSSAVRSPVAAPR